MTLADLTLPIPAEQARQYALVFSGALAQRLAELHAIHGRPDCTPRPVRLTDGRWLLNGDILTAIVPGAWLHAMWQAADKAVLLPGVEVIPLADAVAMLPVDQ